MAMLSKGYKSSVAGPKRFNGSKSSVAGSKRLSFDGQKW